MKLNKLSEKYKVDKESLSKAILKIQNKECLLFTMSGKMGSGKDTIGDLISNQLDSEGYQMLSTSFGYLIRHEITNIVDEYNESKDKEAYSVEVDASVVDLDKLSSLLGGCNIFERTENSRIALQFWGTEVRRKQENNYWINKMSQFVVRVVNKGYSVNITDARFPNEINLVEDLSGKVIRLEVSEKIRIKRLSKRDGVKVNQESLVHLSEIALDDYKFDKVFDGRKSPKKLASEGLEYIK